MKNNLPPEFDRSDGGGLSTRELTGIGRAISDYKKDVLKLQNMPMSADCAQEIINAEVAFRKNLTNDLMTLVELNCAKCPMGFTRNDCQAKSCPFQTIDQILKERLKQLDSVRPGGI